MLYAQISCTATEEFLQTKMYWGLACSSLGALMCLFFRFTMTYLSRQTTIDRKLLDYELVTIEKYSVTGKISPELYKEVIEKTEVDYIGRKSTIEGYRDKVPIRRFKKYLIE